MYMFFVSSIVYTLAYHMGTNKIVRKNYLNSLNLDVCNIQKRGFRLRSDNYWGTSAFTEKLNERSRYFSIVSNHDESSYNCEQSDEPVV